MGKQVSIKDTLEITILGEPRELYVLIEGSVTKCRPAKGPSFANAGGEPEEPSEVEDFGVFWVTVSKCGEKRYQVMDEFLSEKQIETCREALIEKASERKLRGNECA